MAVKDGIRVRELTQTVGVGDLTLMGTVAGYNTFESEIGQGSECFYQLFDANGTDWELGLGTLVGTTLTRSGISRTSQQDTHIVLTAGTHTVLIGAVAGFATGEVDYRYLPLKHPTLEGYAEKVLAFNSTSTINLDIKSSNMFHITMVGQTQRVNFINVPQGVASKFTMIITQDSLGGHTLITPSNVKWDVTHPSINTSPYHSAILTFITTNGGSSWFGIEHGTGYI